MRLVSFPDRQEGSLLPGVAREARPAGVSPDVACEPHEAAASGTRRRKPEAAPLACTSMGTCSEEQTASCVAGAQSTVAPGARQPSSSLPSRPACGSPAPSYLLRPRSQKRSCPCSGLRASQSARRTFTTISIVQPALVNLNVQRSRLLSLSFSIKLHRIRGLGSTGSS